jgi:hypothetical protein
MKEPPPHRPARPRFFVSERLETVLPSASSDQPESLGVGQLPVLESNRILPAKAMPKEFTLAMKRKPSLKIQGPHPSGKAAD